MANITNFGGELRLNGGSISFQNFDPSSVGMNGQPGDIVVSTSTQRIYIKSDSGFSTNWLDQEEGSALTALTGDVTASGPGTAAATIANLAVATGKIAANAVTNAKLAQVATQTIKGRTTASTGDVEDLTAAQVNAILNPVEFDAGNSGASKTIDFTNGPAQKLTLTANCTLTLSNPISGQAYVLKLVQDGTGSRTVTWPAAVKWPSATAPTLTTTAAAIDIVSLYYDGTNFYGTSSLAFG